MSDYWTPEPWWKDERVFVIGGGPSLKGFDFGRLNDKHVLAINEAYEDVLWAEVLFFRDFEWFERVRPDRVFGGLIVSTSPRAGREYSKIKWVPPGLPFMPRARTSGHNAVSLTITMGAKEIMLLGFDWNPEGGNYHERHITRGLTYRGGLLDSWKKYRERADLCGTKIINVTPGSRINDFERGDLGDFL